MRLRQDERDACDPANADAFVLSKGPSTIVTFGSLDGVEMTLDTLEECSPQPSTALILPASPVVACRRTTRTESEGATCWREETTYWREEATYWREEATRLREEVRRWREEAQRKEQERKEQEAQCEKKAEESGSKLLSEERCALSPGPPSTSVGGTTPQFNRSPMVHMPNQSSPGHPMDSNKRGDPTKTPLSQQGLAQGSAAYGSSSRTYIRCRLRSCCTPGNLCQPLGSHCELSPQDST